ncbi:MAG: rhombosortase [Moraxellaceae bacterium]|jgi:rhomboid family GlyGly-CTERM serine protease|nr:rhombosortase [Moraxellaceae bacterium]
MPNSRSTSALLPSALALVTMFLVLALLPGAGEALRYQRQAIGGGELWRLFSGHFVHLNLAHALLNGAGTLMLGVIFYREISLRQWWMVVLSAPLAISLGLWLRDSPMFSYAGFSGVLHALLYFGVLRMVRSAPWLAGVVLVLLAGRQIWEQTAAYDPDYLRGLIGGRVMPDAHLFGALAGGVLGAWSLWRDRLHKAPGTGYSPETGPDA